MGMGIWGFVILVVMALVLGVMAQLAGEARTGYDWLVSGIAALAGGYIASELLGAASVWGPEFDGLFILPAIIGAVVLTIVTEFAMRIVGAQPAT